ncbi:hypothetical protein ASG11_17840 [Sphingomonas sp. Leaf357]|uniref:hypothetical protein n=1 Tax=Sphingomonas sp. Leaf357 TaxID=1736350 RepID=UPI0006F9A621|nr:hypothetical protein [Sphingomonas sp. Leaf357]KQS01516.1 hypothetical protein ASG11_17840 [Sphingomonas sp. Leaf357]
MDITIPLTVISTAVIIYAGYFWRNAWLAVKAEQQFETVLARQLHEHATTIVAKDREAKRAADNAAIDASVERLALLQESDREAQIKAKDEALRAALDLIPATERRDTMKFRRESEARRLIAKTDLATLEAALAEREAAPLAPDMTANLAAAKARIATAAASKIEAEARLATANARQAELDLPAEKKDEERGTRHAERSTTVVVAAKAARDAKDGDAE